MSVMKVLKTVRHIGFFDGLWEDRFQKARSPKTLSG